MRADSLPCAEALAGLNQINVSHAVRLLPRAEVFSLTLNARGQVKAAPSSEEK